MKELFVPDSISSNPMIKQETIKMYATTWCGDCRMAKRWFDAHGVSYDYINIEEDDRAAEYVVRVNKGMQRVQPSFFLMGRCLLSRAHVNLRKNALCKIKFLVETFP